jgi:uncharacterized protein with von Willebrand factor type A (vWA) domain
MLDGCASIARVTTTHIEDIDHGSMATMLLRFVHRLRDAAIPVSMVETIDAVEAARHLDLSNRADLRAALGATLVKNAEDRGVFDSLFDIYFPMQRQQVDVATSLDRAGSADDDGTPRRPPTCSRGCWRRCVLAMRAGFARWRHWP